MVTIQDNGQYGLRATCILYRLCGKEQPFVFHCLGIIRAILRCRRGCRRRADILEKEYNAIKRTKFSCVSQYPWAERWKPGWTSVPCAGGSTHGLITSKHEEYRNREK